MFLCSTLTWQWLAGSWISGTPSSPVIIPIMGNIQGDSAFLMRYGHIAQRRGVNPISRVVSRCPWEQLVISYLPPLFLGASFSTFLTEELPQLCVIGLCTMSFSFYPHLKVVFGHTQPRSVDRTEHSELVASAVNQHHRCQLRHVGLFEGHSLSIDV
jgi:hypothetical protein